MWLRWQKGRQASGYDKLLLARLKWPWAFDCYLLRFPEGSEVPAHKDEVQSGRHFRLNLILKKAAKGGEFLCDNCLIDRPRIKLFRPDLHEHAVSRIELGRRWVLSVGWLLKDKRM